MLFIVGQSSGTSITISGFSWKSLFFWLNAGNKFSILHATICGDTGPDYSILTSSNLVTWDRVADFMSPAMPLFLSIPASTNALRSFYRVMLGP